MEKQIYALKDTVTGEFEDPFFMKNRAEATRALKAAVNSPQETKISKFAGDLQLFELGTFNTQTGEVKSNTDFVCYAIDLKE